MIRSLMWRSAQSIPQRATRAVAVRHPKLGNAGQATLILTLTLMATLAMGTMCMSKPALTVTCRAEGAKVALPEGLCAQFAAAVAAQAQRAVNVVTDAQGADVTLVVTRSGATSIAARIDMAGDPGPERRMMQRGAPLTAHSYDTFLSTLLQDRTLP